MSKQSQDLTGLDPFHGRHFDLSHRKCAGVGGIYNIKDGCIPFRWASSGALGLGTLTDMAYWDTYYNGDTVKDITPVIFLQNLGHIHADALPLVWLRFSPMNNVLIPSLNLLSHHCEPDFLFCYMSMEHRRTVRSELKTKFK